VLDVRFQVKAGAGGHTHWRTSMMKLLPCPFGCDAQPVVASKGAAIYVECTRCKARGPVHYVSAVAEERWNKRPGGGGR
jgi:hypothetical protein